MDVKVKIQEVKVIERTYLVKGVNSLESAEKCAQRCMLHQFQPNAQLWQEVPRVPRLETVSYEVLD